MSVALHRPRKPQPLRLNLAKARLSLPKLLDLLEGLPCEDIDELDVSQNDLGDTAPRALLRLLPELRALRLSSTGLSAEGVKATVGALTERWSAEATLNAAEVLMSDASAASSSSSSSFRLTGGLPATLGASAGFVKSGLQVLQLWGCSVEAAAPELGMYLANRRCTLTELDLSWNALGPDAIHQLGWQLRQNTTLRTLRMAHCHLRESAAVLFACLATAGPHLPLRRLCLARNALPEAAFRELAGFMASTVGQRLEELDIAGNVAVSEECCSRWLGTGIQQQRPSSAANGGPASACKELDASTNSLASSSRGDSGPPAEMRLDLSGCKPFFDPAYGRWDAAPQVLTVLRSPASRVLDVCLDGCTFSEAAAPSLARICLNVRCFSFCACIGGEGAIGQSFVVHLEDLARGLALRRCNSSGGSHKDGLPASSRERQLPLRLLLRELRLNDAGLQDGSAALLADAMCWL
ncbi:unnamed protein product, partial [Polarella glacialis]